MATTSLCAPQGLTTKQSINSKRGQAVPSARLARVARHARAPRTQTIAMSAATKVEMTVREAKNFADLRSAAAVRVGCFVQYPEDRSEYSKQNHRRLKLEQEVNVLERKMTGIEPGYEKTKVVCYLATADQPEDPAQTAALMEDIDPSCKLPAEDDKPVQLVLGSLDLNIGDRFPSEDLQPLQFFPGDEGRAFISNVCVAPGARRNGVAVQMLDATKEYCKANNIRDLYVHVVPSNKAAAALYENAGFVKEREETADYAYVRDRERRMLLLFQCIEE
eukprot:CAMPEP_0118921508 /NCGR_PEP_ID=MMETSP1169-20130426/759_1 /TAXON_ID=36882 /ORGANISM="Pyramimonas obovata, Strain CCMP722" /LENGTH=276 /DNA_ID=CAMNT_0006862239 /DNA_START=50 /DNA_END=880 /DNA_ORIENTATION=-